jgi:transposase
MSRPTDYDPSLCERVIELGREGAGKAEIAAELDVSRQTVLNWSNAHPEFLDALQRAHDLSLAWWEKQSRLGLSDRNFNSSLWGKAMSGRFPAEPYRERQEVSGPNGGPQETVTRIELVAPGYDDRAD